MTRRLLTLFAVAVWPWIAHADVHVDRVEFHGTRLVSAGELDRWLNILKGRSVADDSLRTRLDALEDSLVEHDFLFAHVDSFRVEERHRKDNLVVYLQDGELARVSSVRWLGDSTRVPENVSSRVTTRMGSTFHWSNVAFDSDLLLNYFETSGYPFARVEVDSVEADSALKTVSLWLRISSGPLTRIDFISFVGNRQTKEAFLRRETRLHIGELYDQRRLNVAQRRLRSLEFVRQAAIPELVVNEAGQSGVRFGIEETRSTLIDVAAGYQPGTGNRQGEVSGLANLEFLNLFGAGRRGHLHWDRPSSKAQTVEVAYTEPWVMKQPVSLKLDFHQRIEDTLYVERSFGAQLGFDVAAQVTAWAAARQEAVFADSESAVLYNLPDSRTTYLETGLSFDTRDEPLNPRRGVFFSTFIGNGWRQRDRGVTNLPAGSFRQQRGGVDSEIAHEIFPFWIGAVGIHARAIRSTEPEILLPDLYRLGGARTLRGYREEQFLGSRIGWTSAEIRYWLGPLSRVFAFADAGGVYREQLTNNIPVKSTIYRTAVGLGLRLETNVGVWGIDYGVGQGDRMLEGKLHVSLLSSF